MTTEIRPALRYPGKVDMIDVSSCQNVPGIDFAAVKAAGFEAVVVKGSTGAGGIDPACKKLLTLARAAGLFTMIYLFHIPNVGVEKELALNVAAEGDVHPLRRVIDVEVFSKELTTSQYVAELEKLVALCEQEDGQPPIIYSAPYMETYLAAALASSTVLARCPLWIAQYMSTKDPWVPPPNFKPTHMPPWETWTIHQYSGDGGFRVPGIPGVDCDRSLFNGDLDTLKYQLLGLPHDTQG